MDRRQGLTTGVQNEIYQRDVYVENVTLDYNEFTDCEFRNCALVFAGGHYLMTRCKFDNVRFGCIDAAERTLVFLRFINTAPNGRQLIDELFRARLQREV